jgi:hypothetical protein
VAESSTEPDRYLRIMVGGSLGTIADVCRTCGVMLPLGDRAMPEETTPRFVHDSFHEELAGLAADVALLVHDRAARERYDEEMQERAGG